ncbi:MAG: hypothetical protein AB7I41_18915 [Candidatus Sericytochromatia bacterium]
MHHLIFQAVEHPEGQEIPYAQSQDLIHNLLGFDGLDLDMAQGQNPEQFLLGKACELKKWKISGEYPRFFVENQVEVTLSLKNKGFCRIINARSHTPLDPLTLDGLQVQIAADLALAAAWKSDPQAFLSALFDQYQMLCSSDGEPVLLSEIYQALSHKRPAYRREYFGLDLNRCLNSGRTKNKTHALSVLPANQRQTQSFYVFDTAGTGQWIDQIAFVPLVH